MLRSFSLVAAVLCLCLHGAVFASGLQLSDAWVAEMPPGTEATAGYLAIHNPSAVNVTIRGISSPQFGSVQVHTTELHEGRATMQMRDSVEVPAGATVELAPGASHLMLFSPAQPLKAGDSVTLILDLGSDATISVDAPVRRRAAPQ